MDKPPVLLEPNSRGGLLIWSAPELRKKYVIGADTAEGLSRGDFAAAVVIEAETCDMVARIKERENPHIFGPKCALLGWYFNDAVLAFETMPSAHGITAAKEAHAVGYQHLYRRRRQDTIKRTVTEILGWHTNSTTKPQMIDRAKAAIEADCVVPDEDLLLEARRQVWDDGGKMDGGKKGHDDLLIAWMIALMVRDECYVRGELKQEKPVPRTEAERVWAWYEKQKAQRRTETKRGALRLQPPWKRLGS